MHRWLKDYFAVLDDVNALDRNVAIDDRGVERR
jgi:hypothetical protein